MNKLVFNVSLQDAPCRIDQYIAVKLETLTRSKAAKLCEKKFVTVNGSTVAKNYILSKDDLVEVYLEESKPNDIIPQKLDLNIYYEDDYLAVVEKPKGILTYPTDSQLSGTFANALKYLYGQKLSKLAGQERPGIVHRLDKDTSGLIIVAFDDNVHQLLNTEMLNHNIKRFYLGIVYGVFNPDNGIIDEPIARNTKNRTIMSVQPGGREAKTIYKTKDFYNGFSLVEYELITGRTHQIRVHSLYKGHPLAGDRIYGKKNFISELNGQCLHAYKVEFTHPINGKNILIESKLPDYFTKFINKINNN